MPVTQKVAGLFQVTMRVIDGANAEITLIASGIAAEHEVTVENISTLTRHVRVYASLPNGIGALEFMVNGHPADAWEKEAWRIPRDGARRMRNPVRRGGGPGGKDEPIQCIKLDDGKGAGNWAPITSHGVPFDLLVDAG